MNMKVHADNPMELLERVIGHVKNQFSLAYREDTLEEFLAIIRYPLDNESQDAFSYRTAKVILVIGDSRPSQRVLQDIVDASELNMFEFEYILNYEKVSEFNFNKLRNTNKYCAVLVGPMAHHQKGVGDYSSMIARMEEETDKYPPVIRMRTSGNKMKITNSSFSEALVVLKEQLV